MNRVRFFIFGALLGAIPFLVESLAQTNTDTPQPDDPPSRVARLNWLSGDVSFQPAGVEDWTAATLNYPLTTSDHLFTGQDARAELHIGANAIRLASNSNFGFLNLDDSMVQTSLTEGSMEVHLRTLDEGDSFEIATPNGAITLLRTGNYRIDADLEHDAAVLTVRSGQAELFSGPNSTIIRAGQTAYFQTDQTPQVKSANDTDDFDAFVNTRDNDSTATVAAAEALPADMTGAEDLKNYGTWEDVGQNERAWVPPVDQDWSPYSDGDWAYVEPWGWTWIDAAPWGFAPFHYGRWTYVGARWVWVPGPRNTKPIYSPALVTFIGGGPANSISWIPLGPRDPYTPPWRATANPVPSRVSVNRTAPGAIHSIAQADFVAGRRARSSVVVIADGQPLGSSPLIAPSGQSVLYGTSRTSPAVHNRPLIARTTPPPPPTSFAAKQTAIAHNQGRPLAPKQLSDVRRQSPAATVQREPVRSSVPAKPQLKQEPAQPARRNP